MSLIIMIKNKATNGRPYDIYFGSIINSIEKSVGDFSNAFFIYKLFIDYYFLTDSIIPSAKPAIP